MIWAKFFRPQTLLLEETKNDVSGKPVFTLEFETFFDLQQTKNQFLQHEGRSSPQFFFAARFSYNLSMCSRNFVPFSTLKDQKKVPLQQLKIGGKCL